MRKIFTIAAALALASCGSVVSQSPGQIREPPEILTPTQLTKADLALVQDGIKRILKDPESVRFGNMVAGADSKGQIRVVCLHVNAKNSYGGYTGDKPYMGVMLDGPPKIFEPAVATDPSLSQYRDAAIYQQCAKAGVSIPRT